jgi:hypothetical protein
MSLLFGWFPRDPRAPLEDTALAMSAALRVHPEQQAGLSILAGVAVGVLDSPPIGRAERLTPAVSVDGRFTLWMAGEMFASRLPALAPIWWLGWTESFRSPSGMRARRR